MSAMFRAVVWKELRENLKWAVIVMLGMGAGFWFAIPSVEELLGEQRPYLSGIVNAFDGITIIGGLLAGLAFGVAQTVVENRGDKWGFLAHRPIERAGLFWGKATAGILLYSGSTGLPVVAALIWVAAPGYLPIPFDWRMALPAIANLLCGLVFYFAGFLTGMRDARWYASRALGIGAAFCCLVLQTTSAATFWQAIAMSVAGLFILGTAAWGTFVGSGQYGSQPRIGRIATALSIGLGITLVGILVAAMNLDRFGTFELPQASRTTFGQVTSDGVFVKVTRENNEIVEISDPDGRPLERYRNSIGYKLPLDGIVTALISPAMQSAPSFRSINGMYSLVRRAGYVDPVSWHYVHHLGLLAAYDIQTRKRVGWLGPDGFSSSDTRPRPFAGRMKKQTASRNSELLLVFEDAVYRANLDSRRVEKAFQSNAGEEVLDAGSSRADTSARANFKDMAEFDVISTSQRLIVQQPGGTILLEAPQHTMAPEQAQVQVVRPLLAPGSPTFLKYSHLLPPYKPTQVSQFNGSGIQVNSWTLPPANSWLATPLPRVVFLAAITPPIGQTVFETVSQRLQIATPLSGPHEAVRLVVTMLSAFAFAAAAFLQGRRHAFPPGQLAIWIAISLMLGPLGYLLMLALIEWPARESCPACSRKRVVNREHCEHCGEPFASPPQDGTEIFEPAK
jgi:hypothetical protein